MKVWTIAWQDTLIRLRDRNGLVLMLLAPLIVSAIMGAALSKVFNGAPPTERQVIIVDQDHSRIDAALTNIVASDNLASLIKLGTSDDLAAARRAVDQGSAFAVVHVPQGFTQRPTELQLYVADNASDDSIMLRNLLARASTRLNPGPAFEAKLNVERASNPSGNSNSLAFFAPSMAIFFLMFTMFDAPRAIISERETGTLGRLIRTPTSTSQILLGKLGGSYLTGILQFAVLVIASRLIFNLKWGTSIAGLLLMVIAVVVSASGLGAVIAAFSKDVNQAEVIGGGIAIVSAGLGGNFFPPDRLPPWLDVFSRMTINRWGLEGFANLTMRGLGLKDIALNAAVLLILAAIFFALSFWQFQRRITR